MDGASAVYSLCVRRVSDDINARMSALCARRDGMALAAVSAHDVSIIDAWDEQWTQHTTTTARMTYPLIHFGSSLDSSSSPAESNHNNNNTTNTTTAPDCYNVDDDDDTTSGRPRKIVPVYSGFEVASSSAGVSPRRTSHNSPPSTESGAEFVGRNGGGGGVGDDARTSAGSAIPASSAAVVLQTPVVALPNKLKAAPRASAWSAGGNDAARALLMVGCYDGRVALVSPAKQRVVATFALPNAPRAGAVVNSSVSSNHNHASNTSTNGVHGDAVPGEWCALSPRVRAIAAAHGGSEEVAIAERNSVHVCTLDNAVGRNATTTTTTAISTPAAGAAVATPTCTAVVSREPVLSVDWSASWPAALAVVDASGCVQVADRRVGLRTWDSKPAGAVLHREAAHGVHAAVRAVRWLEQDDGGVPALVTAGDDGVLRVWDCRRGLDTALFALRAHVGATSCIAAAPAPTAVFASGGADGVVRVWNTAENHATATTATLTTNPRSLPTTSAAATTTTSTDATRTTAQALAAGAPPPPAPPAPPPPPASFSSSSSSSGGAGGGALSAPGGGAGGGVSEVGAESWRSVELNKIWNVEMYAKVVESARVAMYREEQGGVSSLSAGGALSAAFGMMRKKPTLIPTPEAVVGIALFDGVIFALNAEGILSRATIV